MTVETVAVVGTPQGLHARPLTLVVQKVKALVSANAGLTVHFVNQSNASGEPADATSILSLLMLCANAGHSILIRVTAAMRDVAEAIANELSQMLSGDLDSVSE